MEDKLIQLQKNGDYYEFYNRQWKMTDDELLKVSQQYFEGLIATNTVQVNNTDLRVGLPYCKPSLILSILTIQFTPIDYRQRIISEIYDRLQSGGAFIFVEKILGSDAKITEVLNKDYWNMKAENGYTQEQIERKKLSLEGVLVPVTAKWNEELLRQAGFNKVDCFWRYLNFAGWIAIK